MTSLVRIAVSFAALLAAPAAWTQTLTWEDALRRARQLAPGAVAATQTVRTARADAAGAGRWPRTNPVVRLGGDHEISTDPSRTFGGRLEQTFDIAGVAIARARQAVANVSAARYRAAVQSLDALRAAADAFVALDQSQRALAIWTALAEMYDQLSQTSARTEEAGVSPRQQTLLAMIEQSTVVGDLNQATADRARARAELGILVGLDDARELAVTSADELAPPDGRDANGLVALALARRPEIPALRAQLDESQRRGIAAALELVPAPTLFFGVGAERFVVDPGEVRPNATGLVGIGGVDHRSVVIAAGLTFPLPIFERNQAERARATSDAMAARENLVIAERRIRAEVNAAFAARSALWGTYRRWLTMSTVIDEATALARRGYEAGQVGITATLVALERVARGRLAVVRSRGDYWRARVALARALGEIS